MKGIETTPANGVRIIPRGINTTIIPKSLRGLETQGGINSKEIESRHTNDYQVSLDDGIST